MDQTDRTDPGRDGAGWTRWWTGLVEEHLDPLWRFVRARTPAAEADDVVQETFVAAARNARQFDPRQGSPWAWLLGIARRKIADHYRRRPRVMLLGGGLTGLSEDPERLEQAIRDEAPLPEEVCQQAEFQALARAALATLEPRHQACLVARYCDDLSLEQVAARLGISRAAANSPLHRARGELRQVFLGLIGDGAALEEFGR